MEYELRFHPEKHLAVVITHGLATLEGFKAYTLEIARHPLWSSGLSILSDHRDLNFISFATGDVENYRQFCRKLFSEYPVQSGKIKIATVVSTPFNYGIVRQWEIPLTDIVSAVHRVFMNYEDATAWLAVDKNC